MNLKLLIFFISFCGHSISAQQKTSRLKLDSIAELIIVTETFDKTQHKIETCDTGLGWESYCLIDGKPWVGGDNGSNLPKNQLISISIEIENTITMLDVSGLYNPSANGKVLESQFKVSKLEIGHLLTAMFSDGAGTYFIKWQIIKDKSIRTLVDFGRE